MYISDSSNSKNTQLLLCQMQYFPQKGELDFSKVAEFFCYTGTLLCWYLGEGPAGLARDEGGHKWFWWWWWYYLIIFFTRWYVYVKMWKSSSEGRLVPLDLLYFYNLHVYRSISSNTTLPFLIYSPTPLSFGLHSLGACTAVCVPIFWYTEEYHMACMCTSADIYLAPDCFFPMR